MPRLPGESWETVAPTQACTPRSPALAQPSPTRSLEWASRAVPGAAYGLDMGVQGKKAWQGLGPGQRRAILAGGVVEAVLTSVALRDLVRRPAGQVRGPKALWALGCFVQPLGPLAYLTLGRRSHAAA